MTITFNFVFLYDSLAESNALVSTWPTPGVALLASLAWLMAGQYMAYAWYGHAG
ncbi:hypothetical protein DPMN_097283 [Dreissena polymorpha]|uniref:Uncharacterized protein n=1 Tax=Dreissena polymorpha TaxID=45954 RepID=A0A9D4LBI1_DREPO|nr:hypothetical protein DPMN_097283 [Dreissena polymorpha]